MIQNILLSKSFDSMSQTLYAIGCSLPSTHLSSSWIAETIVDAGGFDLTEEAKDDETLERESNLVCKMSEFGGVSMFPLTMFRDFQPFC